MKWFWLCVLLVTSGFAVPPVHGGPLEQGSAVTSRYVIRSLGSAIGTVNAVATGSARDNDLRADVAVRVGFWFLSFSLTSTETSTVRNGVLLRYSKTIQQGSDRRQITGEREGSTFTIVVRDGDDVERREFATGEYQTSNMEYPEVELAPGESRTMRVLDLENAEIVQRNYRYVSEERMELDGRPTRVIVADFADKNAECRRWTAIINGLPVVVRQDGKEKTGLFNPAYSVRQAQAEVTLPSRP